MKKLQSQMIARILAPFDLLACLPVSASAMATNPPSAEGIGYSAETTRPGYSLGSSSLHLPPSASLQENSTPEPPSAPPNTAPLATYDQVDGLSFFRPWRQSAAPTLAAAPPHSSTNPYTYTHPAQKPYWHRSPHRYSDTLGSGYVPAMYLLQGETETLPTYCCDLLTNVAPGTKYRRLNLEDATYYPTEKAPHIRGILAKGYWPGCNRLKELEAASGATNLTGAEALSATQCAIWHFANTDELTEIYAGTQNIYSTANIQDTTAVNPKEGNRLILTRMKKADKNIQAVYQYLLKQTNAAPASVIWTFEQAHTTLTLQRGLDQYDITALFQMKGSLEGVDALTLTATLAQAESTLDRKTYRLSTKELKPDANGYYSVTFQGIDASQLLEDTWIALSLDGIQTIHEDVYFYEPYGGYEAAQSFVGYGRGSTPLHSEKIIPVQIGRRNLSLYKYDAGAGVKVDASCSGAPSGDSTPTTRESGSIVMGEMAYPPLSGVPFDLYVQIDDAQPVPYPHPVRQSTDAQGRITWEGLMDSENIRYYCREAQAKAGYQQSAAKLIPFVENKAYVGNRREVGSLKIQKTLTGNPADPARHFEFEILLDFTTAPLYAGVEKLPSSPSLAPTFSVQYLNLCSQTSLHPATLAFAPASGKAGEAPGGVTPVSDAPALAPGRYSARVTLGNGESVVISGIPTGTAYTVTELTQQSTKAADGQSVISAEGLYMVADASQSGRIQSDQESALLFENIGYRAEQLVLSGKKYLDGRLSKEVFAFNLYEVSQADAPRLLETVHNNPQGIFTFSPLTYTQPGQYSYQITESTGKSSYRNDTNRYTVVVTVTQDAQSGTLNVALPVITRSGSATGGSEIIFYNQTHRIPSKSYHTSAPPVDETPKNPGKLDAVPDTGDSTLLLWWSSLSLFSLLAGGGLAGAYGLWYHKRKTAADVAS